MLPVVVVPLLVEQPGEVEGGLDVLGDGVAGVAAVEVLGVGNELVGAVLAEVVRQAAVLDV